MFFSQVEEEPLAAALPRPPQMLSGRIGEGEEEGLDPGRSGEVGWRWRSGRSPEKGDSLLHQSCELKHCLFVALTYFPSPNSRSDSAALASYRRGNNSFHEDPGFQESIIFKFYVQMCSIR